MMGFLSLLLLGLCACVVFVVLLYNHPVTGDTTVLKVFNENQETPLPILRSKIETAVNSLKKGKSPGVDNIPAELILAGDNKVIDVLTTICNSIWKNGKWPTPWTQSLVITLPKRGNLQLCQNYRTISLISHPSKVMLKVIQNRLKPQAEAIIAEEQAGFRTGRSTCEQIFNTVREVRTPSTTPIPCLHRFQESI